MLLTSCITKGSSSGTKSTRHKITLYIASHVYLSYELGFKFTMHFFCKCSDSLFHITSHMKYLYSLCTKTYNPKTDNTAYLNLGYSFIHIVTIPTYGKKPLALPTISLCVSHN